MPESPEVQVLAEFLDERLRDHPVTAVELTDFRALKTRQRPLDELVGSRVRSVARRGKHLDVDFGDSHLVISFGRAGWVIWTEPGATPDTQYNAQPAAVVAGLEFDDGATLGLVDLADWLSLGVLVVSDAGEVGAIAKLGPDPLAMDFDRAAFEQALGTRRKQIKALLQEQETLAGIGNAYSDEILHVAKIAPTVHAAALGAEERERLFTAMTQVLRETVAARRMVSVAGQKGAKVASMRVHGRTGAACPVCGDTVADIPGSKGNAQYCPTCQGSDEAFSAGKRAPTPAGRA